MSPTAITIALLLSLTLSVFHVSAWSTEWIDKLDGGRGEEETDLKSIIKILSKPRVLDRYKPYRNGDSPQLQFHFDNCGSSQDSLQISGVSVSPDPIKLPGNVTASFTAKILKNITAPLTAQLEIKKKILGVYVTIPCIDNVGSCTYKDICSMIPFKPGQPCPAPLPKFGLPCTCPFNQGSYSLPKTTVHIQPPGSLPSFLESGDYQVKVNLMQKGTRVGCYEVQASLA